MLWKGIDKSQDDKDIDREASPDLANCFYYNGKIGVLGPRKGFTATNSSAFSSAIYGIIPFNLTNNNRRFLLAHADGSITDNAASLSSFSNPSVPDAGTRLLTDGYAEISNYTTPQSTVEASASFLDSATYSMPGTSADYALFEIPLSMSFTSSDDNDWCTFALGFKTAGGNIFNWAGAPSFAEFIISGRSGSISSMPTRGNNYVAVTQSNDVATGLAVAAYSDAAGATVSINIKLGNSVIFRSLNA